MKPIWYIIGVACVLISTIGRMADSLSDVLIALGVIALVVLVIWLFETGKIRLNERLGRILKKIGVGIFVVVGIAYLVAMAGFVTYKVATEGDRQGIMLLGIASTMFGISWYLSRWRRRWIKFLKTFMPKNKIRHGDWKMREKYFWTFDYATNAQYGLRPSDGIFDGQARVWLDPSDVDKDASVRLDSFEEMLAKRGIKANCALTAAKYLIAHNAIDEMIELMVIYEQSMYWASQLFVDVIPGYAYDTANRLVEESDNSYMVTHTKRLLTQWKKESEMS